MGRFFVFSSPLLVFLVCLCGLCVDSATGQDLSSFIQDDQSSLCMQIPGNGICVEAASGTKVFSADALEDGLVAYWRFDDPYGLDSSGFGVHAASPPQQFAPGYSPLGFSLRLAATDGLRFPFNPVMNGGGITLTFWIYLLDDANGAWRSVFRKGNESYDMTPTLLLWPKSRRIRVVISSSEMPEEALDSMGDLVLRRWTHVCVIVDGPLLRLYINGVLDSQRINRGVAKPNRGDIFIGRNMYHSGVAAFLDDMRLYRRVLSESEIRAQTAWALGGVGPDYARFGCSECDYYSAVNSCEDGYHLCAYKELYAGGFLVARVQGWLNGDSRVWAKDCHEESDFTSKRVAICCNNQ